MTTRDFQLIPAQLHFDEQGVPRSDAYGDVYHAAAGGPQQAEHVFLSGNDLPHRWQGRERYTILETGFGLGLNFLATWSAWAADPQRCGRLHFISVEKHPFAAADLAIAQAAWPQYATCAAELQAQWPPLLPGFHRLFLAAGKVVLTLVFGDAVELLRRVEADVDAFYLDGFSPACNPELWSPYVCRALARLAVPGATLATWSVAGQVRAALEEAEFDLEKRPGFAAKRQMLVGHYRSRKPSRHQPLTRRAALVIGAGIAGSSIAERLAARGWQVTVLEQRSRAGDAASGNHAGVFRPLPSVDDNPLARLTRAGFLAARRHIERLTAAGITVRWDACGVLQLAHDEQQARSQRTAVERLGAPSDFLQFVERDTASAFAGRSLDQGGWWFPCGGWVQPYSLCAANLAAWPQQITARYDTPVDALLRDGDEWLALDPRGGVIAQAPTLVLACGVGLAHFPIAAALPQRSARGQVSLLPAEATPPLDLLLCRDGYVTPTVDGIRVVGASFLVDDSEEAVRITEHRANLDKLERLLPGFARGIDPAALHGRVSFRPVSPDRLPMVGPVPTGGIARHRARPLVHPDLWCLQGFGARGIVWSFLMAELLASRMEGEPLPLPGDLVRALDPCRFQASGGDARPHDEDNG